MRPAPAAPAPCWLGFPGGRPWGRQCCHCNYNGFLLHHFLILLLSLSSGLIQLRVFPSPFLLRASGRGYDSVLMASVFGEARQRDLSRCRSAWPRQAMGPRSRPPSPCFVRSLAVLVALPCRGLQGSPGVLPLSSSWGVAGAGLDWAHQGSGDGGGCRSPSPAQTPSIRWGGGTASRKEPSAWPPASYLAR